MAEIIVIFLIFMIYMAFRNHAVCREQIRLCNVIYELNKADIDNGTYTTAKATGRYEKLEEISYEKMLLNFWRPVKSFKDDIELN